jgi:undecaprenyl diphosphate synthase
MSNTSLAPHHVAMIMDGNGRWAQERGLSRSEGHKAGSEAVNRVVRLCRQWGMRYLTLYAFSEQNWGRPEDEVEALMSLLLHYIREQRDEIIENRIRLRAIGDLTRLPSYVLKPLSALIQESEAHQGMTLTLALSYGGREELLEATRAIARLVIQGTLNADQIEAHHLIEHLYAPDLPDPDLILRTSGEYRLSNFLLWQAAYAELFFMDFPWPEIQEHHLREAFEHYFKRERRFGLTSAQIEPSKISTKSLTR